MKPFEDVHKFAFYTEFVRPIVQHKSHIEIHEITDQILINRITNVLRLEKGDQIILFDSHHNILCTIIKIDKKFISIEINEIEHNILLKPHIVWLLPILKREAFEEAIYVLTALGVQEIQPVLTQKTKKVYAEKEQRIKKIMIAAAEQSKQFVIPILQPIIPLEMWLLNDDAQDIAKVFFDISGSHLENVIQAIKIEHINKIFALTGPEGDLTNQEKITIASRGFTFCALTKTVLKAEHAIIVALGAFRSLLP